MISTTIDLARKAVATAARVRLRGGFDPYQSICVYDLAEKMGIDLRFTALPSLEGMYSPGNPPLILVSALRQSGRQRTTCAHEIGHHEFEHGTRIDELAEEDAEPIKFEPDEFLVDCFSEFLLMPKLAVLSAAHARGIRFNNATPFDIYRLSSYFGVGYGTILHHLNRNLRELSPERLKELKRMSPKAIRKSIVGEDKDFELMVADEFWRGRPIDLHVGDVLLLPKGTVIEGPQLSELRGVPQGELYLAKCPGVGRLENTTSNWSSYLRIARRPKYEGVPKGGFVGRSIYRHEEDYDG